MNEQPTTTVVIAAYADDRWDDIIEAVESAQRQSHPPLEVVVVIDHNDALLERTRTELPGVRVLANVHEQGASGARNTGIEAASGEIVAFLDDDAVAEPGWLAALTQHFADPRVVGAGGRLDPLWSRSAPRWLPHEFYWTVGASYRGQPTAPAVVRNVWSGNMAVRRDVLTAIGGFRGGFGKLGERSRPEDTEMCLRAARAVPGGRWLYEPSAGAQHKVPAQRGSLRFFVRRCYHEGRGKADLQSLDGTVQALASERDYTLRVLPRGITRGVGDSLRGDLFGILRSLAIVTGLLAAVAGITGARLRREAVPPAARGETAPSPAVRRATGPRILVDQSGYDLLNLGDVAMLQACIQKLTDQWPYAQVAVLCHDAELLARYCPGAVAVPLLQQRRSGWSPLRRVQLASAQGWKIAGPYTVRAGGARADDPPGSWREALRWADMVVASGGGYVNDTWWWHAAGVLSVLDAAQRSGKPTAMFGQGLGPLTHLLVRGQARRVFPRLLALGLRGSSEGVRLARELGAPDEVVELTGDDGLQLLVATPPSEPLIGVNLRIAHYAGVDDAPDRSLGQALAAEAARHDATLLGLPVSLYAQSSDLEAIDSLFAGSPAAYETKDVTDPRDLAELAARCQVMVTGSYHAAVFALAGGAPVVALSASAYYDTKFADLAGLYPGMVSVCDLRTGASDLAGAVAAAWDIGEPERRAARDAASAQRRRGAALYDAFGSRASGETPGEGDFEPVVMCEVELTRPLPSLPAGGSRAWVLVRLHGEPIGVVEPALGVRGLAAEELVSTIGRELATAIARRLGDLGAGGQTLTAAGFALPADGSPFLRGRAEVLADAPRATIVLCTRDRADRLPSALAGLTTQRYPDFEVVVVDNAPADDAVERVIKGGTWPVPVTYVVEPRPGLSWARNAGAAAASGEIVAFIDDDEAPDPHWLAELARGFARAPDVGCVSGAILPARIETKAQDWFEQFGGHSKGRGFEPALFTRHGAQSPLYPLPPFGAGGNLAFRAATLEAIGGFDVALGAGTDTRGGEDTLALTLVLLAGQRVAYQPSALVRHDHYPTKDGLTRQLEGYGIGLTAYYTALLRRRPDLLPALLRLLPRALRDLRGGQDSIRTERMRDFPADVLAAQRSGMFRGPTAYARSVRRQRRAAGGVRS